MHTFKPSRRIAGKSVKSAYYSGKYRLADDLRWTTVALRVTEKEVAQRKLRGIVAQTEREAAGIAPPKRLVEAAGCELEKHIEEFLADLTAKARNPHYVRTIGKRVSLLADECGWSVLRDITPEGFMSWRSRNTHKAAKTLNEFLNAASALLNWLVRFRRIEANPLALVGKVETRGRERRIRRAFSLDEIGRLLTVAGPNFVVYLMAIYTGLRRNELASLVVGDIHLDAYSPFVSVRASTTKNHKSARIELHPCLAEALRPFIPPSAPANQRVFAFIPKVSKLRADLGRAGIPFTDEMGRIADFHSFRHTFTTLLAQAGVPPQVAKELTRHSDMKMNGHYTDATKLPLSDAIRSLPRFGDNAHGHSHKTGLGSHRVSGAASDAKNRYLWKCLPHIAKVPRCR